MRGRDRASIRFELDRPATVHHEALRTARVGFAPLILRPRRLVFPGHTEYVTEHAYDVVHRFRDLGGRLIFLSANDFFWRVEKNGQWMRRVKPWRDLGRPEAALLGVQYRANDNGSKQGVYRILDTTAAPWRFEGTGLVNGKHARRDGRRDRDRRDDAVLPSRDHRAGSDPDLFGPGLSGEMSYYETSAGARVFSAGALDFGGSLTFWPRRQDAGQPLAPHDLPLT